MYTESRVLTVALVDVVSTLVSTYNRLVARMHLPYLQLIYYDSPLCSVFVVGGWGWGLGVRGWGMRGVGVGASKNIRKLWLIRTWGAANKPWQKEWTVDFIYGWFATRGDIVAWTRFLHYWPPWGESSGWGQLWCFLVLLWRPNTSTSSRQLTKLLSKLFMSLHTAAHVFCVARNALFMVELRWSNFKIIIYMNLL